MSDSFQIPSTSNSYSSSSQNQEMDPQSQQFQQQYPFMDPGSSNMNMKNILSQTSMAQSMMNMDASSFYSSGSGNVSNPTSTPGHQSLPSMNLNQMLSGSDMSGLFDTSSLSLGNIPMADNMNLEGLIAQQSQRQKLQSESNSLAVGNSTNTNGITSSGSSNNPDQSPLVSPSFPSQSHRQQDSMFARTPSMDANMNLGNFALPNFAGGAADMNGAMSQIMNQPSGSAASPPNMPAASPSPHLSSGLPSISQMNYQGNSQAQNMSPSISAGLPQQSFSASSLPMSIPTSMSMNMNTLPTPRNQQELLAFQQRLMLQRQQQINQLTGPKSVPSFSTTGQSNSQQILQMQLQGRNQMISGNMANAGLIFSQGQAQQGQDTTQNQGNGDIAQHVGFSLPGAQTNTKNDNPYQSHNMSDAGSPLGSGVGSPRGPISPVHSRPATASPPSFHAQDTSMSGQSGGSLEQRQVEASAPENGTRGQAEGTQSAHTNQINNMNANMNQNQNAPGNMNPLNPSLMQQFIQQQNQEQQLLNLKRLQMQQQQNLLLAQMNANSLGGQQALGQLGNINALGGTGAIGLGALNNAGLGSMNMNLAMGNNLFSLGGNIGRSGLGMNNMIPGNLGTGNMGLNNPNLMMNMNLSNMSGNVKLNNMLAQSQMLNAVRSNTTSATPVSQPQQQPSGSIPTAQSLSSNPSQQQAPLLMPVQFPERAQFEAIFKKILNQRNLMWQRPPVLAGRPIDFYSLFCATVLEGGYEPVSSLNNWKSVAKRLEYGAATNAPTMLKKHYGHYLLYLEKMLYPNLPQMYAAILAQRSRASASATSNNVSNTMSAVNPTMSVARPTSNQLSQLQHAGMGQVPGVQGVISPPLVNQIRPPAILALGGSGLSSNMPGQQALSSGTQSAVGAGGVSATLSHLPGTPVQISGLPSSNSAFGQSLPHPMQPSPSNGPSSSASTHPPLAMNQPPQGDSMPGSSEGPPTKKAKSESEESHNTLPAITFPAYVPKSRRITSFGGIDVDRLAPALQRPRPMKEMYGRLDPKRYALHLSTGSDIQIRYTLDSLLNYSTEFLVRFTQYPELLNQLFILVKKILLDLCPTALMNPGRQMAQTDALDHMTGHVSEDCDTRIPSPKQCTTDLATYSELFEDEWERGYTFRRDASLLLSREAILIDNLAVLSMILRNTSFLPDNGMLMARHEATLNVIFWLLNLPKNAEGIGRVESDETCTFTRDPPFQALEHRKNMLILLANLGMYVRLPNIKFAQLIVDIASDFLSEPRLCYVYPALEALSKIFLITENQDMLPQLRNISLLLERLWKLLPVTGWEVESMTPSDFVRYEFTTMTLSVFLAASSSEVVDTLAAKAGFLTLVLSLAKPPLTSADHLYRVGLGPGHLPSHQAANEFSVLCERSMRILLECAKSSEEARRWLARHEYQLIQISVIAEKKGNIELSKLTANVLFETNGDDHH